MGARFGDSSSLSMRIRTPVMVDTRRREIVFAAPVPVDEFVVEDGAVRTEEFELLGGISEVTIEEGAVRLRLK
ncbi:MAG: hypothetical protein ACI9W4_002552 [Rhodothermales bacterium]|jgi:hypothetical protein